MIRLLLVLLIDSISAVVTGQTRRNIELELVGRYDKHAEYTTRYYDRTYTNDTKLWGRNWGANLNFLQQLTKGLKFKVGLGYYQLGVDKIEQTTRVNTVAPGRTIDYYHPTGIQPLFATNHYKYHNFLLTGGFAYEQKVKRNWRYNIGSDITYLYTFSQLYKISYDNSKYPTHNGRTLGFGVNSYLGIVRSFSNERFYINPKMIVPIYQQLRGDQVFGEDQSLKMEKWFDGVGLSLSVGKYF